MLYPEDPFSNASSDDPELINFSNFLLKYLDKIEYWPPVPEEDNGAAANT
jgi:hypothetical protein